MRAVFFFLSIVATHLSLSVVHKTEFNKVYGVQVFVGKRVIMIKEKKKSYIKFIGDSFGVTFG